MRSRLSELIAKEAVDNPNLIVLSGDHGHDFFRPLLEARPGQFVNCGIIEPAMVGIAAGLARTGFFPIVYGLASFIPMKVLEQIKLDFCESDLHGLFIGDGAGLTYATMGPSHQCIEDIGCLSTLNVHIRSPGDPRQMEEAFQESKSSDGVWYVRVGKNNETNLYFHRSNHWACIVSHGGMLSLANEVGKALDLSVYTEKNVSQALDVIFDNHRLIFVIEDHKMSGGLYSKICAAQLPNSPKIKWIGPMSLSKTTGSYEHALKEQGLDQATLIRLIGEIIS